LAKLTVTQLKRPQSLSPTEQRRTKLIEKLREQLALAEAQAEGKRYIVTKPAWTRDDAGNKIRVQRDRVVKPWWFQDGSGLVLVVRYGARIMELQKGKRAIAINTPAMLPGALNTLIAATSAGEPHRRLGCGDFIGCFETAPQIAPFSQRNTCLPKPVTPEQDQLTVDQGAFIIHAVLLGFCIVFSILQHVYRLCLEPILALSAA